MSLLGTATGVPHVVRSRACPQLQPNTHTNRQQVDCAAYSHAFRGFTEGGSHRDQAFEDLNQTKSSGILSAFRPRANRLQLTLADVQALQDAFGVEDVTNLKDILASAVVAEGVYKVVDEGTEAAAKLTSELQQDLVPPHLAVLKSLQWCLPHVRHRYLVAASDDAIFVSFIGTKLRRDLVTNANALLVPVWSDEQLDEGAKQYERPPAAHRGFLRRASAIPIELLFEQALQQNKRLVFTGHSLGGAVAALCTIRLLYKLPPRDDWPVRCVAFATPSFGNSVLAQMVKDRGWDRYIRNLLLPEDVIVQLTTPSPYRQGEVGTGDADTNSRPDMRRLLNPTVSMIATAATLAGFAAAAGVPTTAAAAASAAAVAARARWKNRSTSNPLQKVTAEEYEMAQQVISDSLVVSNTVESDALLLAADEALTRARQLSAASSGSLDVEDLCGSSSGSSSGSSGGSQHDVHSHGRASGDSSMFSQPQAMRTTAHANSTPLPAPTAAADSKSAVSNGWQLPRLALPGNRPQRSSMHQPSGGEAEHHAASARDPASWQCRHQRLPADEEYPKIDALSGGRGVSHAVASAAAQPPASAAAAAAVNPLADVSSGAVPGAEHPVPHSSSDAAGLPIMASVPADVATVSNSPAWHWGPPDPMRAAAWAGARRAARLASLPVAGVRGAAHIVSYPVRKAMEAARAYVPLGQQQYVLPAVVTSKVEDLATPAAAAPVQGTQTTAGDGNLREGPENGAQGDANGALDTIDRQEVEEVSKAEERDKGQRRSFFLMHRMASYRGRLKGIWHNAVGAERAAQWQSSELPQLPLVEDLAPRMSQLQVEGALPAQLPELPGGRQIGRLLDEAAPDQLKLLRAQQGNGGRSLWSFFGARDRPAPLDIDVFVLGHGLEHCTGVFVTVAATGVACPHQIVKQPQSKLDISTLLADEPTEPWDRLFESVPHFFARLQQAANAVIRNRAQTALMDSMQLRVRIPASMVEACEIEAPSPLSDRPGKRRAIANSRQLLIQLRSDFQSVTLPLDLCATDVSSMVQRMLQLGNG